MTRLVDTVTTPMLLGLFATGSIRASELITHGRPINAGLIVQRADFVPEGVRAFGAKDTDKRVSGSDFAGEICAPGAGVIGQSFGVYDYYVLVY
jgi:hypothetical protein